MPDRLSGVVFPKFSAADWRQPAIWALILANLFPLVGVFVWQWEVFPLLLLFWSENVIVGFFNALRMLCAAPRQWLQWGLKLFFIPFFCFHYGLFTFVHGVFVVALFGGGLHRGSSFPDARSFLHALQEHRLGWPVLGLFISHAIWFGQQYLMSGEFRRAVVPDLMMRPYGRVVVLHLTVLLGGFLMAALQSPSGGLVLLVALKLALDLRSHLRERAKLQAGSPVPHSADAPL